MMTESEQARYDQALNALSEAFFEAYALARKEVAEGEGTDIGETDSVLVPRRDIRGSGWGQHLPAFRDAGRRAGLRAAHIGGEATLVPPTDYVSGHVENAPLKWLVIVSKQD